MDGLIESWVTRLAAALKSTQKDINILVSDWMTLAQQHYPIAVQNTRVIGQEITQLLMWLEVRRPKKCVCVLKNMIQRCITQTYPEVLWTPLYTVQSYCQKFKYLLHFQDLTQFPVSKAHLIGYSLGAHIAGFAGRNLATSGRTLGRITGERKYNYIWVKSLSNFQITCNVQ